MDDQKQFVWVRYPEYDDMRGVGYIERDRLVVYVLPQWYTESFRAELAQWSAGEEGYIGMIIEEPEEITRLVTDETPPKSLEERSRSEVGYYSEWSRDSKRIDTPDFVKITQEVLINGEVVWSGERIVRTE